MPILLIVLFAAAIEKAVIFTDVNFCLFNEFEVPVSQPNLKIVKERRASSTKPISTKQILLKNGHGFLENSIQSTVEF